MNQLERELFEEKVFSIAKGLDYPRTPDIAGSVMTRLHSSLSPIGRGDTGQVRPRFVPRKLAWSLTLALILLSSLMLIPPVRAAILEFIQIGVVRIFPPSAEPTATPASGSIAPITATPSSSSSTLLPFLDQIAGETTLANAQQMADYGILLPAYPSELGQPDRVYVQDANGFVTILVWEDPQRPGEVILSLHFIPAGSWAISKFEPQVIEETSVNGRRAVWTEGPYPLILTDSNLELTRLVDGHVLVWTDGDITYRLETGLPLEEAIRIAESLQPIP
jgi:hypothetical protein